MLVASVAGFQPGPRMAADFASKAYVLSLGEALAFELRARGQRDNAVPRRDGNRFLHRRRRRDSMMAQRLRRMNAGSKVARLGYRGLAARRRVVITGAINRVLALAGRYAPHRIHPAGHRLLMSGD